MQFSDQQSVSRVIDDPLHDRASGKLSKAAFRFVTSAIIAASIVGCGPTDGDAETPPRDEPSQSIWLNPLKVNDSTHRVTAKFQTFVCPNPIDLERAVALHNTGKVDRMAELGCRYLSKGDQGVQLDRIGRAHEILFETDNGSVELWGLEGHYDKSL